MTVTAANVRVGLTGAISKAPYGSTGPTNSGSVLDAAYVDSGGISEEGVTISLPDSGSKTPIRVWQNGAQVRVLRTPSDDLASISFTFLETNKTAVETYFETTVTAAASDGSFEYAPTTPTPHAYVLDVLDDTEIHRFDIPRGMRASVGDLVYSNGAAVGYQVTIEMEVDPTKGYALKGWMTDLKTPA